MMEHLSELLNCEENYYHKLMKHNEFVLFGASKNSENPIKHLLSIGKKIRYICDNDKLKWGKALLGIDIVPPSELASLEEDIPILIVSSFHREIRAQLLNMDLDNVHYIYKLGTDAGFYDSNILKNNRNEINKVIQLLADERSKMVLESLIKFRCTQDFAVLKEIYEENQYYPEGIIKIESDTIFVDAGAYDGNTAVEFVEKHKDKYKQIYSFEPEKNNFIKMKNRLEEYRFKNIEIFQKGLSNKNTIIRFSEGQGAGSKIDDNGNEFIETLALDDLNLEGNILIKMDIEGEELNALVGAKNTIAKNKPRLAICIYHKSEDLWLIPLYIKSLVPEYKIYIRHHHQTPWETVCYATL